jgi:hypothetical protein
MFLTTTYSENSKLANWVVKQRNNYRLQQEGNISQMTLPRIQALESLGFEWTPSISRGKGTSEKPSLDDDANVVPTNSRQGASSQLVAAPSNEILRTTGHHEPVGQSQSNTTDRSGGHKESRRRLA